MHNENIYHRTPSYPLRRQMTLVIDRGPELRPVSLSLAMKSTTVDVDIRAHLVKVWGKMP